MIPLNDHSFGMNRIKKRVKTYSHKVYKKMTVEQLEDRKAIICQRENPFYVDTVRAFRDRRMVYKDKTKQSNNRMPSDLTPPFDVKCGFVDVAVCD
jgi:DNA polymerase elongation subunit (family B)